MTGEDNQDMALSIEEGRKRILRVLEPLGEFTFIRGHGNVGDDLIFAGTRQLLANIQYREASVLDLRGVRGDAAVLSGSGAWCNTYHAMPQYLQEIESRFERVVVLPSSFDVSVEEVRETLSRTKATVFAREAISFEQIRGLCDAGLAHDCALYFDYQPYRRAGRGVLTAYRIDREAARPHLPAGNNDISMTCESLDEFLWTIARHELIRTDRAHVTIAAAMLGKQVEYSTSNYHKVPAIVAFSLRGLPVVRAEDSLVVPDGSDSDTGTEQNHSATFRDTREADRQAHMDWLEMQQRAREEIESLVPGGAAFIFVDDDQWGREPLAQGRRPIPFTEKNGVYWGPPAEDSAAIAELERLRQSGAGFIVFAWPAFWWLSYYAELHRHLDSNYRRIWRNERLHVFDLR